jgi:molecular chaperone GrpE
MAKRSKAKQDEANAPVETAAVDDGAEQIAAPADGNAEVPEAEIATAESGGVTLIDPNPELTAAKQEVMSLQARLRAVSAAYKQLQDEVQATKERLERQAQLRRVMQRGETVGALFEPLDNLNRSIGALAEDAAVSEDTRAGFALVVQQFMEAFRNLGLEEVPGKGHAFDPNLHEAISVLPVTDPSQDGQIIEVFSTGYRVGNRLLTPARVVIGRLEEAVGDA